MRIIKFRGKHKGYWVYGSLLQTNGNRYSIVEMDGTYYIGVNPDTIGAFTGIYDSTGNEIYEGDIIKTKRGTRFSIRHSNNLPAFEATRKSSTVGCDIYRSWIETYMATVIGNIYDNPELLK
jgi:hypothetical protein